MSRATRKTWGDMKGRCLNPAHRNYADYGGRGISICERWLTYENFLADMGERPPGRSLDRLNNDGNYEPSNCRWATPKEQARNTRSNRLITYKGETKCMAQWADDLGLPKHTLEQRVAKGWDIEKALTTPYHPTRKQITFNGKSLTKIEWARELGIRYSTLRYRLEHWTLEKALGGAHAV